MTYFIGGYKDNQTRDIFSNKPLDVRTWGHFAAYKGNIFQTSQLNLFVSCICVVHNDTRKCRAANEYDCSARPCVQKARFTWLALVLHILTDGSVLSTCAAWAAVLSSLSPDVSWLCPAHGMMEQERGSATLQMEMHHLEEPCYSPGYACISSVLQCPPLDAGGVCA